MSDYMEMVEIAKDNNTIKEFNKILDDYFDELEKYHPQTYANLMKELYNLSAKINLTEDELEMYIQNIHHENVPELWTVDETTSVAESIGINFDEWKYNKYTFNYVMNMMRSDYYTEFQKMFSSSPLMKQTILDNPAFYAHMAKAWLDDEDAPADKAVKYICLVNEDDIDEEDK